MTTHSDNARVASAPGGKTGRHTRVFNYNSDDLQHLFAKIIASLSSPDEPEELAGQILGDVCRHFRFGCGFIYEADHTRTFHIKERYSGYETASIPESFRLENYLAGNDMETLLRSAVFYQHLDPENDDPGHSGVFDSNTFMLVPVLNKDNRPIGLVGMMDRRHNILFDSRAVQAAKMVLNLLANTVKLRLYQRSLEYARESMVGVLDNTGVDIYVSDFHTQEILYVNRSMAAPYGGRESLLGKKCWEALYDDKTGPCDYCPKKMLIDEEGKPTKIYSWDYRRPFDGSWFRVLSAAFHWVDGRLAHVVSSVDITENKNNEATIAKMANYDALTNLPNRRKLMTDCKEAMEAAEKRNGIGYLLFFDLDKFKRLNDSMGHQAGDQLLAEVGRTLQEHPLTKNHGYRYGGDEFILLYDNVERDFINQVVRFLLNRFEQPWKLSHISTICRASIGVASYPNVGKSPELVLHNADMLMYKAKQNGSGRGIACFCNGEVARA